MSKYTNSSSVVLRNTMTLVMSQHNNASYTTFDVHPM
jgi:hypothetical protein